MRTLTMLRFRLLRWARHVHERLFILATRAFCFQCSWPGHTELFWIALPRELWHDTDFRLRLSDECIASISVSKGLRRLAELGVVTLLAFLGNSTLISVTVFSLPVRTGVVVAEAVGEGSSIVFTLSCPGAEALSTAWLAAMIKMDAWEMVSSRTDASGSRGL